MRIKATGVRAVLLALPFVLMTAQAALAADAPSVKSDLSPQQEAYQKALQQEFQRFLAEHPEYLTLTSNEPEGLRQRRDLGQLWQERATALQKEHQPRTAALADAGKTVEALQKTKPEIDSR